MTETGNYSTGLRSGKARHLEREEPASGRRPSQQVDVSLREAASAVRPNQSWSLAMVIAVRRPAPTFLGYTPSLQNAAPQPYDATVTGFLKVP
jgi:hypothetical protein